MLNDGYRSLDPDPGGRRSLGAAQSDGTMFCFHGCKGLQPSEVNDGYRSLDPDPGGRRSLGAAQSDGTMFCFHGCKGLQPSKVNDGYRSLDPDPGGRRSLGAVAPDGTMFSSHGWKGVQPTKSMTAIEVLNEPSDRSSLGHIPFACFAVLFGGRVNGTKALRLGKRSFINRIS